MPPKIDYMLDRLSWPSQEIVHGLAQQAVRDDAGARTARSALLLWRAMADRSAAGRVQRDPLSCGRRRLGRVGGPRWRKAAAAPDRRYPAAAWQSASCHA